MDTAKKLLGAALFIYAALYVLQVIFNGLYTNWLDPSPIWTGMNFCTAAGIIISLIVVWRHRNGLGDSGANPGRYLAVQAGFYATLVVFHLLGAAALVARRPVRRRSRHRGLVSNFGVQPSRVGDSRSNSLEHGPLGM